ncbi:hypothetical protein ACFYRN_43830 [Streptomyces sp. NPDC005227]|uniref:hypothetical protein n=1 Tax=Streptomyces sp. NPDC005227 TaxID=3364707 RepID=UPI00367C9FED
MDIATLLLLGAAGGAVRGIMHAYDCMTEWLDTSGQISGGFTVFAAGASAPLVLVQLKNSRLADAILGEGAAPAAAGAAQSGSPAGNGTSPGPVIDSAREGLPAQRPASRAPVTLASRRRPPPGSSPRPDRAEESPADQDGAG